MPTTIYVKGLPVSDTTKPSLMSKEDKAIVDKANTLLTKLAGGTTGQVLKKKSNVDYDFEWVTP